MNAARNILIHCTLLVLFGCGSSYQRLMKVQDVPHLAAASAKAADWPTSTRWVATTIGEGPPAMLAVHETGNWSSRRILVLLHGGLADHSTWRFVQGILARDYYIVMVDLLGAGDSDRPDPDVLGPDGYSPDDLAERVLQALETCMPGQDEPGQVTLVGHSLGGMIALRMTGNLEFRERYAGVLDRVDQMILLSPGDFAIVNPCAKLVEVAGLSDLEIAFADLLGILRERVSRHVLLRAEADRLVAMLRDRPTRRAQQAMLKRAIPRNADGLDWAQIARLEADYANVEVPCQVVWGRKDETIPAAVGYKLTQQLPMAELLVMPDCGHSIQIEQPELCAALIRRFVETESLVRLRSTKGRS